MIIVYTGNGKGKTCACVGQAIRALGHGRTVAFGQFMKRSDVAGEQKILSDLLGDNFRASGAGFLRHESDFPCHKAKAMELLDWAESRHAWMLVLDEAIYALGYGIIDMADLEPFIRNAKKNSNLVLSGRNAPDWLLAHADIVTVMQEIKHPLANGISAQAGIEF